MSDMDGILKDINSALKGKRLYPPGHPGILQPAEKACNGLLELLKSRDEIFLGRLKDVIIFDENPIIDAVRNCGELLRQMEKREIQAITFEKGFLKGEFMNFLDILSSDEPLKGLVLQKAFLSKGITHITLKSIPIGKEKILEVYQETIKVVEDTINQVRLGNIPKTTEVSRVTNVLTDLVLEDKNTMIGLTMIKNYDNYLFNHSANVSILSVALGEGMGYSKPQLYVLGTAGLLHDMGKVGVAEEVIRKPGNLSSEEWQRIRQHPELGSKIAKRMDDMHQLVPRIILEHHIGNDHSGYPESQMSVHPFSMIVTITDSYDAMTTLRVYQRSSHPAEAIRIMLDLSGKRFDPEILKTFINMLGLYPVGTPVRLASNEIGIVTKVDPKEIVVKVIFSSDGVRLSEPHELNITPTERDKAIVAPVDPLTKDIDLSEFFETEAKSQSPLRT